MNRMILRTGFALAVLLLALGTTPTLAANIEPEAREPHIASTHGKTLNERLIEATRDGHLDEVEALIRDGAKVDARTDFFSTPLILAASTGQVAIVQALLKTGANVDAKNIDGVTALMSAARAGHIAVVRILLDAKAQVNLKDDVGCTALHQAARKGKIEIMELLLAAGADILAQDKMFGTPLHEAAVGGDANTVRCLLRHGCPLNVYSVDGCTLLQLAVIGNSTNVIKVLLDAGADINAPDATEGQTALMYAAALSEKAEVLQLLIQSHADVNKIDNQGWTALMRTRFSGQDEAAKILKQAGGEEHTNLSYAAATGDLAAVRSLLTEHGTNRPSKTELGDALCLATQKNHADIVKELLTHGADPNTRLNGDWTPLLSCKDDVGIARQLVAAGANVNEARTYNGDTPLMYAACYLPAEFVNELISKGAHVNTTTENGDTAVGWAALGGKLENMKVLVQHGANINIHVGQPDGYPGWPFITAISRGDAKVVEFLLSHGADINAGGGYGKTPLMYAVKNGNIDVVELLIAHGVNVFARADYDCNNTALKLAENTGKSEIAGLLRIMEFENGNPADPHPWGTKLVLALAASTSAQLDNRPLDNAALLQLTKEIVAAPDTSPPIKADARFLAATTHLETLKSSGTASDAFASRAVESLFSLLGMRFVQSDATALATVEADIRELQKDYPDDVRTTIVQQKLETLLVSRAETPLNLKFRAVDGTDVDLAKLRGKVVLVDFWATWCSPCRAEVPNVVATYNQFHKDGFEVIGISLDQNKEQLVNFTKQAGMAWPQYFDGKGWENEISTRYEIKSVPTMWLVDKKGLVRSTEIQGDTLAAQVKTLLAE